MELPVIKWKKKDKQHYVSEKQKWLSETTVFEIVNLEEDCWTAELIVGEYVRVSIKLHQGLGVASVKLAKFLCRKHLEQMHESLGAIKRSKVKAPK